MRWSATDPRDGWRRRFALLPVKIGDQIIWLEWFERRVTGHYYEIREIDHA